MRDLGHRDRGRLRGVLPVGRDDQFHAVVFSPDGATLAATASGGKVKLFDVATLAEKSPLEPEPTSVHALAYSPDGKLLAMGGSDEILRLYAAATGKQQKEVPGHGDIAHRRLLARQPHGGQRRRRRANARSGTWPAENGSAEVLGHLNTVTCQTFSPDGTNLASGDADRRIILWDPATWQRRWTCSGTPIGSTAWPTRRTAVRWCPAPRTAPSESGIAGDGKELNVLRGHVGRVRGAAISPDGRTLASARSGRDGETLGVLGSAGAPGRTDLGAGGLLAVAFAPDGTLLVCHDTELAFWDIEAGREIKPRVRYPAKIFLPRLVPRRPYAGGRRFRHRDAGLLLHVDGPAGG